MKKIILLVSMLSSFAIASERQCYEYNCELDKQLYRDWYVKQFNYNGTNVELANSIISFLTNRETGSVRIGERTFNYYDSISIPTLYDGTIKYGKENTLCIDWPQGPYPKYRDICPYGYGVPLKHISDGLYEGLWERRPLFYGSLEDGSSDYISRIEMGFILTPYDSFGDYLSLNPQTINTIIKTETRQKLNKICKDAFSEESIILDTRFKEIFPGIDTCNSVEIIKRVADYFNLQNINWLDGQPESHTISYRNTKFLIDELFPKIRSGYLDNDDEWSLTTVDQFLWIQSLWITKTIHKDYLGDQLFTGSLDLANNVLDEVAYQFLYSGIDSEDDIRERIEYSNFSVSFVPRLMHHARQSEEYGAREERIEAVYRKYNETDEYDRILDPEKYKTDEQKAIEKFESLALTYYDLLACFENREAYQVRYISTAEIENAYDIYKKVSDSIDLEPSVKVELDEKAQGASTTLKNLFRFGDKYDDNGASICRLQYLSITQ
jgi:hypothetical protein